jgi:hypothetical protein
MKNSITKNGRIILIFVLTIFVLTIVAKSFCQSDRIVPLKDKPVLKKELKIAPNKLKTDTTKINLVITKTDTMLNKVDTFFAAISAIDTNAFNKLPLNDTSKAVLKEIYNTAEAVYKQTENLKKAVDSEKKNASFWSWLFSICAALVPFLIAISTFAKAIRGIGQAFNITGWIDKITRKLAGGKHKAYKNGLAGEYHQVFCPYGAKIKVEFETIETETKFGQN